MDACLLQIVNFYFNLIQERSGNENFLSVYVFNTFFYPKIMKDGHKGVRRWTRQVDLFTKDLILIPIHLGMHWCLAVSSIILDPSNSSKSNLPLYSFQLSSCHSTTFLCWKFCSVRQSFNCVIGSVLMFTYLGMHWCSVVSFIIVHLVIFSAH